MDNNVKARLQSVRLGEPQTYKNITILPLTVTADGSFCYHTLAEALATGVFTITEVSAAGSVPELLVTNRGPNPVLLVDGEELAGAKQNRVLNTSILLKKACETKIPVSCTERGRWAHTSHAFSDSGNVMAYKSRSHKSGAVHASLEYCSAHHSDQGQVWSDIDFLYAKAGTHSPTSAMSDIFKARQEELRKCDEIFHLVPNQVGLLALINGLPAGLEIVSLYSAYSKLHSKLVRSYTLEGLLDSASQVSSPDTLEVQARKFLDAIHASEERPFPSVGHGTDFCYRSTPVPQAGTSAPGQQSPGVLGSALVHENEVIHAAFFSLDDQASPNLAFLRARRHFQE